MNEELNNFAKKKCSFCGRFFYKLKVELAKYNMSICDHCHKNSLNDNDVIYKYFLKNNQKEQFSILNNYFYKYYNKFNKFKKEEE